MYYNNSHYWLDGDAVNVNGLQWYTWQYETDPDYYDDTHLFLLGCFYWVMADHHDPTYEFRFLCEKLLPEPVQALSLQDPKLYFFNKENIIYRETNLTLTFNETKVG